MSPDSNTEHDSAGRWARVRAMLASPSPSLRVCGLEEAGLLLQETESGHLAQSESIRAKRDAALLLGYLDRLAERYGPPEVSLYTVKPFENARPLSRGHKKFYDPIHTLKNKI